MASKQLPLFESNDVHTVHVRITNASDGLSDALQVQPKALQLGERVHYVLEGTVTQINHKQNDEGVIDRVHTVKANAITEIDPDVAQKALQAAAEETERLKAESSGQTRIED